MHLSAQRGLSDGESLRTSYNRVMSSGDTNTFRSRSAEGRVTVSAAIVGLLRRLQLNAVDEIDWPNQSSRANDLHVSRPPLHPPSPGSGRATLRPSLTFIVRRIVRAIIRTTN